MKILIAGFALFVIWSFFSTWLYVDVLRHAAKPGITMNANPIPENTAADSLAKLYAMMPGDILIYYEFNETQFKADPQLEASLSGFKNWLDKYPGAMITVTGHTDLVGEKVYNQDLGLERAKVVQKYLEGKGFPASRILTISKGEDEPAAGYVTDEERAKNRRTVISIKK